MEKKFKENWNLYVGKDRKHLKNLICKYKYDLFYFDSDKSLNGKMFLFETTKKHNNDYFMIFDDIEDNNLIAFKYCNEKGDINEISNPNGSSNNIAGILNNEKNILGMMPHPERLIDPLLSGEDGSTMFESLLKSN